MYELMGGMWTRKLHVYSDGAGKNSTCAQLRGQHHLLRNLIIVPDDAGEEAVAIAANDLRKYIKRACRDVKVVIKRGQAVTNEDLRECSLVLLGNDKVNGLIPKTKQAANLAYRISYKDKYKQITGLPLKDPGAGFSVRTIPSPYSPGKVVILLEGEDKLGMQYAVYDWLEEALGVRFLSPYFEYCPRQPQLQVPLLNFEETGNFALRRLEVWGYPQASGPSATNLDASAKALSVDKDYSYLGQASGEARATAKAELLKQKVHRVLFFTYLLEGAQKYERKL